MFILQLDCNLLSEEYLQEINQVFAEHLKTLC